MESNVRERMADYMHCPESDAPMCAHCTHYCPHYNREGHLLSFGHCVHPRMKQRRAYDLCEHFQGK